MIKVITLPGEFLQLEDDCSLVTRAVLLLWVYLVDFQTCLKNYEMKNNCSITGLDIFKEFSSMALNH